MNSRKLKRLIKRALGPTLSNVRFLFSAPLAYAPGHFYSPICAPAELARRYRDPWASPPPTEIPGIDLARDAQVALWEVWGPLLPGARTLARGTPGGRYGGPSGSYDAGDAIVYGCMLRHLKPARLIEIGCGSSSALALDTFERFFPAWPKTTFIDPYPAFLRSLLRPHDLSGVAIIESGIQEVSPSLFDELGRNDVLFIDSTHIVKTGSDVVYELFEILPRLRPGVVIHFHDMFWPFEYPSDWVIKRNYSWNELYVVRAFLTGNRDWEVMFFNDYFVRTERERVARDAPEALANPGGGLWLRRR